MLSIPQETCSTGLAGQRWFCCCHVPVFALALQWQHRGVFLTCLLMLRSLQQTEVSLAYTISRVACCQLPHSNSGKSTSAKWIWLMWDWDPMKPSWFTAVFNGLQHSSKTWPSSCDSSCWWFCQPLLPECSKKHRSYMWQLFAFLDVWRLYSSSGQKRGLLFWGIKQEIHLQNLKNNQQWWEPTLLKILLLSQCLWNSNAFYELLKLN